MSGLVRDVDGRLATPEVARLLARLRSDPAPPYEELGPARARRLVEAAVRLQGDPVEGVAVRDLRLPEPGRDLEVRLYTPPRTTVEPGSTPLLVYLHGGGWVTGSIAVADAPCRDLCASTGCLVASVGYALSPEHPFPAALEDAERAVVALAERRAELGLDPHRLVLVGDSAGGHLAAVVAREHAGLVTDQVLLYPALDPSCSSPSFTENAADPVLPASSMRWFWEQYAGRDPAPRLSAWRGEVRGAPRAFVLVCGLDVLRDEGLEYASWLERAGVPVHRRVLPGTTHGFLWMGRVLTEASATLAAVGSWIHAVACQHNC